MSTARIILLVLFFTLGILTRHTTSGIKNLANGTRIQDNANRVTEGHESPRATMDTNAEMLKEEMTIFRERYRRLIPYMTYYLTNNFVANNAGGGKPTASEMQQQQQQRRPQQQFSRPVQLLPVITATVGSNGDKGRFVPSIRYDPKELLPQQDGDYFVPVAYRPSDYEDFALVTPRPLPPIAISETRYRATGTGRPTFLAPKPPSKQQQQQQPDYAYEQTPEEFESVRFVPQVKPRPRQPLRYYQQQPVVPRPPSVTSTVLEPVPQQPASPVHFPSLQHVFKSLTLTNRLPEALNRNNLDSSIRTLLEILSILNTGRGNNYAGAREKFKPTLTKPKVITESNYEATQITVTPHNQLIDVKPPNLNNNRVKPQAQIPYEEIVEIKQVHPYISHIKSQTPAPSQTSFRPPVEDKEIIEYYVPIIQDIDEEKGASKPEKTPSVPQSIKPSTVSTYNKNNDGILEDEKYKLILTTEEPEHKFPPHVSNIPPALNYGATRGKPHIDYPAYTKIPETNFSCKKQRYKGFFGDPATGCQVWHYCDLNGGKSSFLCPNGTIFSQVALTCDWWFNVKCEATTQLYVLNERLYKYILPIMPKFPEDFSGPEVDKYLELKFKEMEANMKEKKKEKEQEEKDNSVVNTLQSIEDSK